MATIEMASNSNPDRSAIRENWVVDEAVLIERLVRETRLDAEQRSAISARAADLVAQVRALSRPSMMESFLAEYGLSTDEGVGLMCLAEALLRVPDADTVDALISDKIEPGNWGAHLGQSSSMLVNAATWALLITGRVLDDVSDGPARSLRALVKRVGEPVVRAAVARAIRILGDQFVLGETIEAAVARADRFEALGYTYSYDMLGEAARTHDDAARYLGSYRNAIEVAGRSGNGSVAERAGVSIKLSALHPRYEWTNRNAVRNELVPIIADLATEAADHGIGLNIDAEEANRLEVSLDVIADVIADPRLSGWSGLGIVVQAYGSRALPVIDWLHALAAQHERRIMVRLVKGAYWDSEVKHAQVLGLPGYPVFTRKPHTDVSYLAAARRLLDAGDRIYPQFATHNAHTAAAVHAMTSGRSPHSYEFQRLHGMGEALHEILRSNFGTRCRIYAPVGAHQDLLAYLVRRLLENGANSSFVNQIVDEDIPPSVIASDPIAAIATGTEARAQGRGGDAVLPAPASIFEPVRRNSKGYDVNEPASIEALRADVERFRVMRWTAEPIVHGTRALESDHVPAAPIFNPARSDDHVGSCRAATPAEIAAALDTACAGVARWSATPATDRASALRRAAELFEANTAELCALCMREAGKTLTDAIAEVREAVDFLTYYAHELERRAVAAPVTGRGLFVCISPWNFPLAIFTGQIAAALAAGNTVIAKPAEQTPLVAARAVDLLLAAGVAPDALQLLPGDGPSVGAPLTGDPRVAGVCFTGSTEVARLIDRSLASNAPHAVLIAETGGLNAMVVDSTALPEQAVRDIVSSAFQSAGQRCSALRVLYVQNEVAQRVVEMLTGAMNTLVVGDPWRPETDVGPVIDRAAQADITAYCAAAEREGRLIARRPAPDDGTFAAPAMISVGGIDDVPREVFGPVLHVARFSAGDLDAVVDAINARRFGLTFGLHTRIDDRVEAVVARIRVGNVYVNRNQIGAVVGSQPFGGEGLSGTGPKAGGPTYLDRFIAPAQDTSGGEASRSFGETEAATGLAGLTGGAGPGPAACPAAGAGARAPNADHAPLRGVALKDVLRLAAIPARGDAMKAAMALPGAADGMFSRREVQAIAEAQTRAATGLDMPGPTGESNRLTFHPRGAIVCLGPRTCDVERQAIAALALGNSVLVAADALERVLRHLPDGLEVRNRVFAVDRTWLVPHHLTSADPIAGVMYDARTDDFEAVRRALSAREGPIVPLVLSLLEVDRLLVERHVCVDTTAAGGNARLLAESAR